MIQNNFRWYDLDNILKAKISVIGLEGIDTRALN